MNYFEINTERLILKPLGKNFLKSVISYAMNYENTKYMCHLPDETVEEVEEFLTGAENEWKNLVWSEPVNGVGGETGLRRKTAGSTGMN